MNGLHILFYIVIFFSIVVVYMKNRLRHVILKYPNHSDAIREKYRLRNEGYKVSRINASQYADGTIYYTLKVKI